MDERDQQLIDRYLAHKLDERERADVENRRRTDPVFDAALREHDMIVQALRLHEREQLRKEFASWDAEMDKKKPDLKESPGKRLRWVWLSVAILAGVLIWWFTRTPSKDFVPVGHEGRDSIRLDTTTHLQAPAHQEDQDEKKVSPQDGQEMNRKQPDMAETRNHERELFAAYFKPYKDDIMDPTTRGDAALTVLEQFQKAYWEDDYPQAVALYSTLHTDYQSNDNFRFMYANALLASGKEREAIPHLESILSQRRSRYLTETYYTLALARLHAGETGKAIDLLSAYTTLEDARRKEEAASLLQQIR